MSAQAVSMTDPAGAPDVEASRWGLLYKIGGAAALIGAVFIPFQIAIFILWPPPGFDPTLDVVTQWFAMFNSNWFLGLLNLDLLIIVEDVLAIPMIFAFYFSLRRSNQSLMVIATALYLMSVACFFASNPAFTMLNLSKQFAAATTEAERSLALTSGQLLLATYQGTASQVYYFLGAVSLLMVSVVMLPGNVFSKATGYVGIAANVIAFGLYVPEVGIYISVFSVVFLEVWNIMVGIRLLKLGQAQA